MLVLSPVRLKDGDVMMTPTPQVVAFNLVTAKMRGEKGVKERPEDRGNRKRGQDGNLRPGDPGR